MIKCTGITASYPGMVGNRQKALDNVDLEIHGPEFIGVIGPNGSGKSSLALCLAGLHKIDSGTLEIEGRDISDSINDGTIHDTIGIVFQDPDDQLITNTVEHEIAFALENRGIQPEVMRELVGKQIDKFNLDQFKDRSPHDLSGGQKQKLAVASALISDPVYIILDEPTSFLDPVERKDLFNLMREEFSNRKDAGFSVILITQFAREAAACDRVIVMDKGKIIADGDPEKVFSEKLDHFVEIGVNIPLEVKLRQYVPDFAVNYEVFGYRMN
ncbi:MAG: ATP-binding cassette domain-containing protein [bacterium]|nr:ATP-binding cassette domain-containing protein [bacterium]